MNDRDSELDELLKPLMNEKVPEFYVHRWKKSLRGGDLKTPSHLMALAAGILIGVVGSFFYQAYEPRQNNSHAFATLEKVFIKSE